MTRVEKAVITAAGRGSRMRYITSVMPKALLPLFKHEDGKKVMIPLIDAIMESLALGGVSKYCLVVGQHGKLLMDYLFSRSGVTFVIQQEPRGFGDAVLRAEDFASNSPFYIHADDGVLKQGYTEATRLFEDNSPDGILLIRRVKNPRRYGVAEVARRGEYMGLPLYKVVSVEEKPHEPKSDYGISAVYLMKDSLFNHLRKLDRGHTGEVELTTGIEELIRDGGEVMALEIPPDSWINVGDPESYYRSLQETYSSGSLGAEKGEGLSSHNGPQP